MTPIRLCSVALALLLMAALAACASAGSTAAPAVATSAAADGAFVWQDLVTTDAAVARRFYSALLGWEFADAKRGTMPYAIASTSAGPVGGLVDVANIENAGSQWVSYVSVGNLDRAIQQVQAAGGKVIVPPTTVSAGRASVVTNPQGAALGLLQPSRDTSAPGQPPAAHFFWREYLAQDSAKALDFYKNLFGYDSASTDARLGLEYFVLRGNRPRAGLFQIPDATSQVKPHWLPYLLVDNPAAMAAKVPGLGGRVLLEPSPDRRNGTLAIIADPTGGVVALQKFPI